MAFNETHCLILYVDMRLYKVFIVKINMLECTGVFYKKKVSFFVCFRISTTVGIYDKDSFF